MKENIELITATIGLITALLPLVIKDKYESKKTKQAVENRYNTQTFQNINTYGNGSNININAVQNYSSTLTARYKDENIRQKVYRQKIVTYQKLLKCFLVLAFMITLCLNHTILNINFQNWIGKSLTCYLSLLNGLSLGYLIFVLFLWIDRKSFKSICNVDKTLSDSFSQIIRYIEGTIYPIILFIITLINLYIIVYDKYLLINPFDFWWLVLSIESIFYFYKIFNLIVFNNIYVVKVAIRDIVLSIFTLVLIIYFLKRIIG